MHFAILGVKCESDQTLGVIGVDGIIRVGKPNPCRDVIHYEPLANTTQFSNVPYIGGILRCSWSSFFRTCRSLWE